MADIVVLATASVIVEEQVSFTLLTLCQASGADRALVEALVGEELLQPVGRNPDDWRFSGEALRQTRQALRLARDFELDLAALGLVMALLTEIDRLRSGPRHP